MFSIIYVILFHTCLVLLDIQCLLYILKMELRKKVDEYKMLKEREEEQIKREEFEKQLMEVEKKQRQATELISRFRDRVRVSLTGFTERIKYYCNCNENLIARHVFVDAGLS